jgi:hypothetical protein
MCKNLGQTRNTEFGLYTRIEENLEDHDVEWKIIEWLLEKEDIIV